MNRSDPITITHEDRCTLSLALYMCHQVFKHIDMHVGTMTEGLRDIQDVANTVAIEWEWKEEYNVPNSILHILCLALSTSLEVLLSKDMPSEFYPDEEYFECPVLRIYASENANNLLRVLLPYMSRNKQESFTLLNAELAAAARADHKEKHKEAYDEHHASYEFNKKKEEFEAIRSLFLKQEKEGSNSNGRYDWN